MRSICQHPLPRPCPLVWTGPHRNTPCRVSESGGLSGRRTGVRPLTTLLGILLTLLCLGRQVAPPRERRQPCLPSTLHRYIHPSVSFPLPRPNVQGPPASCVQCGWIKSQATGPRCCTIRCLSLLTRLSRAPEWASRHHGWAPCIVSLRSLCPTRPASHRYSSFKVPPCTGVVPSSTVLHAPSRTTHTHTHTHFASLSPSASRPRAGCVWLVLRGRRRLHARLAVSTGLHNKALTARWMPYSPPSPVVSSSASPWANERSVPQRHQPLHTLAIWGVP